MRLRTLIGREIAEEVAAKTDKNNEFPRSMWEKLGGAGYKALKLLRRPAN